MIQYLDIRIAEGDLEFVIDILEANLEAVLGSTDEDAPLLRRHLKRVLNLLYIQQVTASEELGNIISH